MISLLLLSSAHRSDDRRAAALVGASLSDAGFKVLHVCVAAAAAPLGVQAIALPRGDGVVRRIVFLARITLIALRSRPYLLHANEPDTWAAALLAKALIRCRVVFDAHEDYLDTRRLMAVPRPLRPLVACALGRLFRSLVRVTDGILCISTDRAAVFPIPHRSPPAVIVRNTVRRTETLALPRVRPATLARFEVLAVGAMTRERGWPVMIAAIAAAAAAPFRCIIVGPVTDGSEQLLQSTIEQLAVGGRVEVTGRLSRGQALQRASEGQVALVLFASGARNHETALPHKLFEAMALGLAVIVAEIVRPAAALVRDVGCGVAIEAECDDALTEALTHLFFRPLERLAMSEFARRACLGRLAWDEDEQKLVAFYRALVERPSCAGDGGAN